MARIKGTHQLEKKSGTAKSREERRKYSGMSQREYMKTVRAENKNMKAKLSKEDYKARKLKRGDWGYIDIVTDQDDESYDPSYDDPVSPFEDGGKIYGYHKGGIVQHD